MEQKYIESELIRLTRDLIQFKTTQDYPDQTKKCMQYIKDYFIEDDLIIKEFNNSGKRSLYICFKDKRKSKLLLNGHIDVVPGDEEQYTPYIKNNNIYGRGAVDMKGGVAAFLLLFKELAKQEIKPDIALMIVSDEEIGGFNGTRYLIEDKGYSTDFAMASEPGHGSSDTLNITIAEKGLLWLKVKTKGKSCHGSRPWLGDNAIEKLMDKTREIKKLFPGTTKDNRWKTTVNIGTIKGGDITNKVAESAQLTLDIRYTEETSIPEILKKFKTIKDIEVDVLTQASMMINPDNVDKISQLQEIAQQISGKEVKLNKEHGASDLRFTSAKNIPSIIFGPYGKNHHGKDEYVSIASLTIYYQALKKFVQQYYNRTAIKKVI
jgi:succinyl-diaminopimelate desuccinylase